MFTLQYQIIETNNYWNEPQPVIYQSGSLASTGIPANSDYFKVTLPFDVKAVNNGTYSINIILTTKVAVGDIPAGYQMIFKYTPNSLGAETFPFPIDNTRTPEPVIDEEGEQVRDENGYLQWIGGDQQPDVIENPYEERCV